LTNYRERHGDVTRILLGCFGFGLAVAYCPFIHGAPTTPRWLLLAAVVPISLIVALLVGRTIKITAAHIVGAAFIGWACLSLAWSSSSYDSIGALWELLLLAGCFALGSLIDDLSPFFAGAAIGLGISSALVLIDVATGWRIEDIAGSVAPTPLSALFGNKNYLAEMAALVCVGIFAYQPINEIDIRWSPLRFLALVGCLVPALALTGARGALLAIAVVTIIGVWQMGERWVAVGMVQGLVLIGIAIWVWKGHLSVDSRLHIWADTVLALNFWGHGIGTLGNNFSLFAHLTDPMPVRNVYAHNDLLQIAYELGVPGVVFILGFIVLVLKGGGPERYIFIAFLVEAAFAFPSHFPSTAAIAAVCSGCAANRLPRLRLANVLG
jgi:O-antigen ligase